MNTAESARENALARRSGRIGRPRELFRHHWCRYGPLRSRIPGRGRYRPRSSPMVRVVSARARTRALLSDSAMLKGMSSVASMSRSMIGREYRTSREEMSISPTKGTSPRSAATPAPRERRHEAATKSDTAPGSASPVDKYSIRASAVVRRRTDDSIGILQRRTTRVRPLPSCPLRNLAELTSDRPRTHTKRVPK